MTERNQAMRKTYERVYGPAISKMSEHDLERWIAEFIMGWDYQQNPLGWRLWMPNGSGQGNSINDEDLPQFSRNRDSCDRAETLVVNLGIDAMSLYARHILARMYETEIAPDTFRPSWLMACQVTGASARYRCEAMYDMWPAISEARAQKEKTDG